jgi:peroxiredoxin Q/BCP
MIRIPSVLALVAATLAACGGQETAPSASPAPVGVSSRAPAFAAPDQTGTTRTLEALRGKAVVLYFYPRDATPGCTREACAFRDAWDRIEAAGATVVGVSTDDVASHAAFAEEHGLTFPLLSDSDGAIARAYGVPMTLGMVARTTFIIDRTGIVRRVFDDVDPAVHADEVIAVLESLRNVEAR